MEIGIQIRSAGVNGVLVLSLSPRNPMNLFFWPLSSSLSLAVHWSGLL